MPLGVVTRAGPGGPVVENTLDQPYLVFQRRNDVISRHAVSSARPGDIMQIQVGDRRGDDLPVFVDHRIMDQGDV